MAGDTKCRCQWLTYLVVEVVVSLAETEERRDPMVAGRAPVVEGLVAKVMSEAVDGEGALLNGDDAEDASVDEPALPIPPAEPRYQGRHDPGEEYRYRGIVLVLPDDEGVIREVGDVGATVLLVVLVEEEPAHVCVPHYSIAKLASRAWRKVEDRP